MTFDENQDSSGKFYIEKIYFYYFNIEIKQISFVTNALPGIKMNAPSGIRGGGACFDW